MAAGLRDATCKRPRGLATWNPHSKTVPWIEAVNAVLYAERDDWPVGPRHIAYQLVGQTIGGFLVEKGTSPAAKKAWKTAESKVQDVCNRGRRSGIIPWAAIADGGVVESYPRGGFHGEPSFWSSVRATAENYRRNLLEPQSVRVEVWAEAAGMVHRLANVAHAYGVPVFSGGGFDSVDGKRRAALRVLEAICAGRQFVALHVGDLDQHGHWLFGAIAEDVEAIAHDEWHHSEAQEALDDHLQIRRLAVTPEQVELYDLAADPDSGNMQAEAVPAAIIRAVLTDALEDVLDLELLDETRAEGETERASILERLEVLT
jgi:hypothetical protein